MKKSNLFKALCCSLLASFLVNCGKSSFQTREGSDNHVIPTTTGVPNYPQGPEPDNCIYQHEAIGSFSYTVHGHNNVQLYWNPFHSQTYPVAYYQVVVKDKLSGRMFASPLIQEKPPGDHSYHTFYMDPEVIGVEGLPMKSYFVLQPGEAYWYDITAYNSYGHAVNVTPRGIDISQVGYPRHHREAGFCRDYKYDFYPGYQ